MGKPKKRTSPRRSGSRRSHAVLKLARKVNAKSPVKVQTTRHETGRPNGTPTPKPASAAKPAATAARSAK